MFAPTSLVKASSQQSADGNANTTYSTDSNSYITGANITTSGTIGLNVFDRELVTNMYITNTVNGQTVQSAMMDGNTTNPMFITIPTPSSTNRTSPSGNTTFTAQSNSGNYYGTVTIAYYYNGVPHSYAFTSNYSVSFPGAASVTVFTRDANTNADLGSNPSVKYGTKVNIFWSSEYATSCSCNLNNLGWDGIGACNPLFGSTIGTNRPSGVNPISLYSSQTISVNCW
jgi:hypothetical protein